jgi:hypothetical protein
LVNKAWTAHDFKSDPDSCLVTMTGTLKKKTGQNLPYL